MKKEDVIAGRPKDGFADLTPSEGGESLLELARQIALVEPSEVSADLASKRRLEAAFIAELSPQCDRTVADFGDLDHAGAGWKGKEDMACPKSKPLIRLASPPLVFATHVAFGDVHACSDALVHHFHMKELIAEVLPMLRFGEPLLVDCLPEFLRCEVVLLDHVPDGGFDLLVGYANFELHRRLADEFLVDELFDDLSVDRLPSFFAA